MLSDAEYAALKPMYPDGAIEVHGASLVVQTVSGLPPYTGQDPSAPIELTPQRVAFRELEARGLVDIIQTFVDEEAWVTIARGKPDATNDGFLVTLTDKGRREVFTYIDTH